VSFDLAGRDFISSPFVTGVIQTLWINIRSEGQPLASADQTGSPAPVESVVIFFKAPLETSIVQI